MPVIKINDFGDAIYTFEQTFTFALTDHTM